MASLIVRRNGGDLPRFTTETSPVRFMRWDPFREIAPSWPGEEQPVRFTPDFEVKENSEGFVFTADVPGVKEKDLDVTMTGNRLTINGKREAQTEQVSDTYYACERAYGSFTRAFTMPDGTDGGDRIRAELRDGVLSIVLPKKPELQPRRIELKTTDRPPTQ